MNSDKSVTRVGKVSVSKKTRRSPWRGRWRDSSGVRRSQNLHKDKAKALAVAKKINAAVLDGAIGPNPHEPLKRSLEALLSEFERKLVRGAKDKHKSTVLNGLRRAFLWMKASKMVHVTTSRLEAYLDYLMSIRSAGTVKHHRGYIKQLFRWAYDTERIQADPSKGLQDRDGPKTRRRQANPVVEFDKIIKAADEGPHPYEAVAVRLGYYAGMRQREILGLRWCDIEIMTCSVCEGSGQHEDRECPQCRGLGRCGLYKLLETRQKNKKDTVNGFLPEMTQYLDELRVQREQERGAPLGETELIVQKAPKCAKTLSSHRKRLIARAGYKYENIKGEKCDWHSMRHSAITNNANHMTINQLKEFARHADIKTTSGYMHTTLEDQWAGLAKVRVTPKDPPPKPDHPAPANITGPRLHTRASGEDK